jgi:hypothetical protein
MEEHTEGQQERDKQDQNLRIELSPQYLLAARIYLSDACKYVTAIQKAIQAASKLINEKEIWPLQCKEVIDLFQERASPLLSDGLPFSSLEVKLLNISSGAHTLVRQIQHLSPIGREQNVEVRKLRRDILNNLDEITTHILPAIDLINSASVSVNHPLNCPRFISDIDNEVQAY